MQKWIKAFYLIFLIIKKNIITNTQLLNLFLDILLISGLKNARSIGR